MVKMEILYEVSAKEGESPVHNYSFILKSKIKSVKFYWKKAKPFAKAKYIFMTNREQVLWRKDDKQ
jgi:hypothetical protein